MSIMGRFRSLVADVQGMQIILEKDGQPFVIHGRGDRDVMTAESARRRGKLVEVKIEGNRVDSIEIVEG